jgi:hypothetical protein
MLNSRHLTRAFVFASLLAIFFTASVSQAHGQDFSLTPLSELHPVSSGGSSTAVLELLAIGIFNNPVSFTCTVTSGQTTGTAPLCLVSPDSATPGTEGAQISVTVTTTDNTAAGTYQITVTGTSGSLVHTVPLSLGVTSLTVDYTLSVSPTTATPNPVTAGSIATTTVTVSPIGSYSGHTVTLSCLSISPTVLLAPVCSFNPPSVVVTSGLQPTSVMSIITTGPAPTVRLWHPRVFYALWLFVPGLALLGLVSSGAGRKKILGALLLAVLASGLLLLPACGSSSRSTSSGNVTPKNSYVFTLTGADENGAAPSNTTANQATVTVSVN